jgi:hypothetical protein
MRKEKMNQIRMYLTMAKEFTPSSCWACCLLSGVISIFIGIVTAEGKDFSLVQTRVINEAHWAQENSIKKNRRDPFKRLGKTIQAPETFIPPPSHSDSEVQDPEWKLLGVIHGQEGHLAIIQTSPKERVVLQAGSELFQTGWRVKFIGDNEVVFEYSSPTTSRGIPSPPKIFILSFPFIPHPP